MIQDGTREPVCDMFRQGKGLHGWGAQTFLRHALSCIEADFSVSLDATPNLHFDRLISTTFPEVVEKGRASILQARLISTTSSESGHAVMYGPESHKHENVDSGPRRLVG